MSGYPNPRLDVEYFDNVTFDFGPGELRGVIHDAINVGWSWYSRFPGAAFFTLKQRSFHVTRLHAGLSHVRIWYTNERTGYGPVLVFAGRIGDPDESGSDVVFPAFGYLAELAVSRTGYRVMYERKLISEVVQQEWQRDVVTGGKFNRYGARKQQWGLLQHVGTGTIQNPHNVGAGEMRTEPQFGVIAVPRLLLMYDLSEIGRANTTANVTYEITRSTTPVFNFWRDRGSLIEGVRLMFPGNIRSYRFAAGVMGIRNDLATIGTKEGKAKFIQSERAGGTYGYETFGRRQDTFSIKTLSGFKNLGTDEGKYSAQRMITERAVKEATRPMRAIRVDIRNEVYPAFDPFDGWDIEDEIPLEIKEGRTDIARTLRIIGARGLMDGAGYSQSLILSELIT